MDKLLELLGICEEDVCTKCSGIGRRSYPNTATWRSGPGIISGQAFTEDVCDSCWGSGRNHRKGADLRVLRAKMDKLEEDNKKMRAIADAAISLAPYIFTLNVRMDGNHDYEVGQKGRKKLGALVDAVRLFQDSGGY